MTFGKHDCEKTVFSFQDTSLRGGTVAAHIVRHERKPQEVGVDWSEGPPVPIPNTEVKLSSVDDSMRVTACENR